jgi:putative flippase GtrA
MVGVVNTMVDYGLMNLFLFTFNVERGIVFVIIKTFTISLAIAISYYLNRS